jgi:hypothetical protein
MITKTKRFIQGNLGKCILYALMISILYTGYGCVSYRQVSMPKSDFAANEQIQSYLADYSIYVHNGETIYRMEDVAMVEGKDLSGKLVAGTYDAPKTDWKRAERKAWWALHKYDIHFYTHDNLNLTASTESGLGLMHDRVVLTDHMIKDIQVMGIDMRKSMSEGMIVLVVIGSILAFFLLITLAVVGSAASAGGSDSDSDSGDSGSGDSGDSDSGS